MALAIRVKGYGTSMSWGHGNSKSCQGDIALASHFIIYGTSKSCHGDMALASHVMGT